MQRKNISSNSPWEDQFGYSRAVIAGERVHVSGTTGTDESGNVVSNDPYEQAKAALQKIERALIQAGSSMNHVYRYRTYITDSAIANEVLKAHTEYFKTVKPAATLVVIKGLLAPEMIVEIEVDAMLS